MTAKLSRKYIVSDYVFADHSTYADAEAERQRLRSKHPGKVFHVYCILEKFQNYEDYTLPAKPKGE